MSSPPPNPTRLVHCPGCGYDLAGLPARHRCPECNFVYDESMFVLEGWSIPVLRDARRPLLYVLLIGGFLTLIWRVVFGWSWTALLVAVLVPLLLLGGLVWIVRRKDSRAGRALIRYLVSEEGIGITGRRTHPWREYSHLMLLEEGQDAWRIHLYPNWRWIFTAPMVNVGLRRSRVQAEMIRDELQRRISAAHRKAADEREQQRSC